MVRELLCGSHRFNDIRRGVPRMSATLLTQHAGFLMRDIRRFAQVDQFPAGRRVVIHFSFTDAPRGERLWWLVVENRTTDLCRDDPGHEITVIVESTVRALTEVWTGDSDPQAQIAAGGLSVQGAGRGGQMLWRWLGRSMFAPTRLAARRGTGAG